MSRIQITVVETVDDAKEEVCFCEPFDSRFGRKISIATSSDAYNTMMNLEWDRTHRKWASARGKWTIDFDSLAYVIKRLHDNGFSVAVSEPSIEELYGN